jgi:hypothetical protein
MKHFCIGASRHANLTGAKLTDAELTCPHLSPS